MVPPGADLINSAQLLSIDTVHSHLEDKTTFESLKQKVRRSHKGDMMMSQLLAIIHKYADSDVPKDDFEEEDNDKKGGKNKGKAKKRSNIQKRKGDGGSDLVAATSTGGCDFKSQCGNFLRKKLTAAEILALPCRYHNLPGKPAAHTTDECSWTAEIIKVKTNAKKRASGGADNDEQSGMPPTAGFMSHTFAGLDSKREEKVIRRAVHATLPYVPQWLNW